VARPNFYVIEAEQTHHGLAGNKNARDFYEAHGWRTVNEFTGLEIGEVPAPMVLMRKRLPRGS
jgi:hypothetical protein